MVINNGHDNQENNTNSQQDATNDQTNTNKTEIKLTTESKTNLRNNLLAEQFRLLQSNLVKNASERKISKLAHKIDHDMKKNLNVKMLI